MTGIVVYLICFAAFLAGLWFLPKKKRTRRVGIVLLAVAVLFEVFVANFHSFHLLFGGYEPADIDLSSDAVGITGTVGNTLTSDNKGGTVTVTLTGLDRQVGTVYIRCDLPEADTALGDIGTPAVTVKVDAKDETQSASYRTTVADGQIVRGNDRTAYIVLDLSGQVSDLRLRLTAAKDQTFTLEGITLNRAVPMHFSALRLCLFMLVSLTLYALCAFPGWRAAFGERQSLLRTAALVMTALMMLGALAVTWLNMYDTGGGISTGFANERGNQITQELVDAFEAGQVSLLDTPGQDLLDMENPYDWSARRAAGVYYKWDHLLYEGKYYSYYGIAPVILLFLPYHVLTGYYFPTAEAVFLFGAVGILFLTLLFLELADRYGRGVPNNILLCTLFVMQISSGVWYNFMADNFYEIAQACGFMFTCAGFFFLFRAGVLGGRPIRYRHLALSSVCLSFAVLSRPTLALYCFAALIFLYFGLRRHMEAVRRVEAEADPGAGKKEKPKGKGPTQGKDTFRTAVVKYLVAALVPFVVIGGVQMLYNYARFGSVLDFGIQYSLTINDFTRSRYHTDFVMIGLYNFLLAFPIVKPEFPYVFSNFSTLSANGYYYVANQNAVGLLFRSLPVFGYLGVGRALKTMGKKERVEALCLVVPTCILVPLAIIFSIWESGYGVRYCTDFAWQLILGGALVLWYLYVREAGKQMRTVLERFFVVAAVVALVINGAMLYEYANKSGYLASAYLDFERLFDFWI